MGKWLSQFSDNTLENRTDKPDILPLISSVSGMSGSSPSRLPKNSSPSSKNIPGAPSSPTVPDRYCTRCGGGYWIRPTHEAPYQCGRCIPSQTPVETLYIPGGSNPLTSQVPYASSTEKIVLSSAPSNARAMYWEAGDGRILGPAVPEFLGRNGDTFWIATTFEEQILWINADRLRSRRAFEQCQQNRWITTQVTNGKVGQK
jgi:hypothetical protein